VGHCPIPPRITLGSQRFATGDTPFPFTAMNLWTVRRGDLRSPRRRASEGDSHSRSHVSPDGSGGAGGRLPPRGALLTFALLMSIW
jgi:hypothetical protein